MLKNARADAELLGHPTTNSATSSEKASSVVNAGARRRVGVPSRVPDPACSLKVQGVISTFVKMSVSPMPVWLIAFAVPSVHAA